MSHYRTMRVTLNDRDALIEALRSMGIEPELNVSLITYFGSPQPQVTDIVVRNRYDGMTVEGEQVAVGAGRADMGFRWNPDANAFDAIVDEYGGNGPRIQKFVQHVSQRAAAFKAAGALKAQGYAVENVEFVYDRASGSYDVTVGMAGAQSGGFGESAF